MNKGTTMDDEINQFINKYINSLLNELENRIIGIYLFGSLTYGGFDKKRSDIDIVVITDKMFKEPEINILKDIHTNLYKYNSKWAKRFETSYTPLEMLKEKEPPIIPRPYYGGVFYDEATYGNEWLINNYLLYKYGKALYGPKFAEILQYQIDIKDVQNSCAKDFHKEWEPKINDNEWLNNSHYQSYIILNCCRIVYTLSNGELANKNISSKWTKENNKQWETLITEAEEWNYEKTMERKEETSNFIKYVSEIVKRWEEENNW
jgi:predicted nucleotidyltransferase